ncbi:helix-turn-helix domain-containing protein [Flagellimonas eckloniae]|uniref:Helix-turn-helix domain-containing protein n=1 Tax=Flagellimonas eckloniae TaxID=346185 RepID=A0A0Q1H972_9FLAO|nr:helix-turn-helix domain-containing protein [Allomuricauda eckloniae]KQC30220.1 hypothetical protein AAY42_10285 [Allomuricauda eckloniae]
MDHSKNDINSVVNLLIDQLAKEVSERVVSTIKEELIKKPVATPQGQKLLVDTEELCRQLSISKSSIIKLRKQGMPVIKIGDSVRFEMGEVNDFITKLKSKL